MGFLFDFLKTIGSTVGKLGGGGVAAFVPLIVTAVEKIFPDAPGPDKLNQVLTIVRLLFPEFFKDLPQETVKEFTDGLIEVVSGAVKVFHAVGVFRHKEV